MARTTIYPNDELIKKVKLEVIRNEKFSSASEIYCKGAERLIHDNVMSELNQIAIDLGIEKRTKAQKKQELENDIKYFNELLLLDTVTNEVKQTLKSEIKYINEQIEQLK